MMITEEALERLSVEIYQTRFEENPDREVLHRAVERTWAAYAMENIEALQESYQKNARELSMMAESGDEWAWNTWRILVVVHAALKQLTLEAHERDATGIVTRQKKTP